MGSAITPVVLSGGSGTRLWPLSLPDRPKQLRSLVGDETMIQATVRRAVLGNGSTPPIVVCNEQQVREVAEQLDEIGCPPRNVVVEPVARNTAPAVAAAAMMLDPDAVMTVLPADHLIRDTVAFRRALSVAVAAAARGSLVAFGVVPTRADTGFGYIEAGESDGETAVVSRFLEKPDPATAQALVERGCLWNSGMFVFTAADILEELRIWEPEVVAAVGEAVSSAVRDPDGVVVGLGSSFADAPSISIDHAVMERTKRARVVPLNAGWTDVGSWQSLWETVSEDGGTVSVGDVYTLDVRRSYVRSESRPVAVIGLDDVVVVETPEAVLVMDRRRSQEARSAAEWFARLASEKQG